MKRCFLNTPGEETSGQSAGTTKVQHAEPVSFIWVTYKNMVERIYTTTEMTQRKLHHEGPT